MYLEIYRSKDGWRFRLKSNNHRIVSVGESYTRRFDALRGARLAHPGVLIRRA